MAKDKNSSEIQQYPSTSCELVGIAPANNVDSVNDPSSYKQPNAFTELMSKPKKTRPETKEVATPLNKSRNGTSSTKAFDTRDGLSVYIEKPETNPEGRVVEYDDDFVLINDKYPKASVHLLLLPRDLRIASQHPLRCLSEDPIFLGKTRAKVEEVMKLAASELRRQYGHLSASDAPYQEALENYMSTPDAQIPPPDDIKNSLPAGRDWLSDIVAGVHTHPSMTHFHIHILSREMGSSCMKHKKHYLSFNSDFLVQLDEFPLELGSKRFKPGDWPNWEMRCWRCGKNFGNKFTRLKEHIGEEFEKWKKE